MNGETLPHTELEEGSAHTRESTTARHTREFPAEGQKDRRVHTVSVASTFTADPLQEPLRFWAETLELEAEVAFAPYGQVMQELLNPESLLSRNKRGFNILLIRMDDWIRDRKEESQERNIDHIRSVANELVSAIGVLRARSSASLFLFLCPASSSLPLSYKRSIDEVQRDLMARLAGDTHVHCWAHTDLARLYPILAHEDPIGDRVAHIPYTSEYFVSIATLFARRISALVRPHCKVIVVDCDNTLWRGICGEDGADGIEITPAHLEFQRMLVRQHDAGMLLCLCSKNNPADVEAVFKNHPQMPLREEHLVASRINWNSKSSNLLSLARELNLSLDSFILVDDSPLECDEVRSHCPSVLTLQLPETQDGIAHFLDHVWAFDRVGVTEEAKDRTAQYKQNRARNKALEEATDLAKFLASLELKVDVSPMQSSQLARVAELVQRTNQFNLTAIRRRASEIETLWSFEEFRILTVKVRDRFGDYGLVGALFFRQGTSSIEVDTFVLSCRVLGRGVEYRIVNELGRIARQMGVTRVVLRYKETARNAPARSFLERTFHQFRTSSKGNGEPEGESTFVISIEYAENVGDESTATKLAGEESTSTHQTSAPTSTSSTRWHDAAYRLSRSVDLVNEINRRSSRGRRQREGHLAPRTSTERAVARIWAEVLGLEEVGVHDDFFDLGGDSLLAVQAITRMASVLGAELSVYEFFEEPTVEKVAEKLGCAAEFDPAIEKVDRGHPLPLSSAQQRLWFIDQLEGGSAAYHIPLRIQLRGKLDRPAMQAALDGLLSRHEALRTVFVKVDGEPVQRIATRSRFALQLVDVSAHPPEVREAEVLMQAREELTTPFHLSVGPLIRGRLLQLAEDEHVLLVTMHHIVSDGWSIGVLLRELAALYEAFHEGRPDPLPPLPIQYADYAQWQRQWLAGMELQEQLTYWKEHLQSAPELLELPTDRPRRSAQSYRGASVRVSLGSDLATDLRCLSRRFNVTLAMTLHTAWSILLARLCGQEDIVVGMPVANRRRSELEGLIGFFVNTVAVRVRLDDDPTASDLLQRVKGIMLDAYAHQDAPFEQVVKMLQPARSLSHSPIFQVMFALQTALRGVMKVGGITLSEREVPLHTAQFDLMLSLRESDEEIIGSINYATDLFDAATIERWAGLFRNLLTGMVHQPDLNVSRLPLTSDHEQRLVTQSFNATHAEYPKGKLIHQLIEEQVARTPEAIAVVYENESLTYAELNARANQLAAYLRGRGAGPERLVGICVERSVEMVVGLLGILKSGAAYVPLDPGYPIERLAYMLEDAAPRVLLTQQRVSERLPSTPAEVIALDTGWNEISSQPSTNLDALSIGARANHLAYVIYTSGSTGKPKGAMNEHGALLNRLYWMQDQYRLCHSDRVLQKTPFSFDVSVWEFFWPLMSGARLVIARPEGHKDPDYLRDLIETAGVTTLHFVPSMLQAFVDKHVPGQCPSLQHIVCSGEELSLALQNKCLECFPRARLSNLYGPTEAAVDVTFWECQRDERASRVPIGRPISNIRMYVLDRHRQPVPIGVAGEICIGGVGVGRGYANRPCLTAERFVPDPFGDDPKARLYETGDLGSWRADGAIEYLGRNDHQVKIRGCRIELGEIESQLIRHSTINEAVVIARGDSKGDKQLVAYVTQRGQVRPGVEELRAHLKTAVPDYMVPSAFVMLERMPLTPNGKLDRRALPAPELDAYTSREYEAPQGEVEEILAGIWQSLLRVERVGRQGNFFELGGHSLLVMQVLARIESQWSIEVPIQSIFESPMLSEFAARIEELRSSILLDRIAAGGAEIENLLETLASMSESRAQELLQSAAMEEKS